MKIGSSYGGNTFVKTRAKASVLIKSVIATKKKILKPKPASYNISTSDNHARMSREVSACENILGFINLPGI